MECATTRSQLEQFLRGELEGGAGEALEQHVTDCPRCVATVEEIGAALFPLTPRSPVGPTPQPDGMSRLLRRLRGTAYADVAPFFPGCCAEAPLGVVGKYQLMEEIGRGTYGHVYRANDTDLSRPVALKVLKPAFAANPTAVAAFVQEAQRAASVKNDHIVIVHEVIPASEEVPWPAFAMELLDGSLAVRLQAVGGRFSPRQAVRYALQTATGLAVAHARGLVHRDIKPLNLLLQGEADRVKIGDFGIVRVAGPLPAAPGGSIQGTPGYMSPEQRTDPGSVGPASDVYNLGVTLYELLAGLLPADDGPHADFARLVDRDLEAIVRRCLAVEPEKRYTAERLCDDLRGYLGGRPVKARPAGRPRRAWMWARRNPGWAAFLAAGSVALITTILVSTSAALRVRSANASLLATVGQLNDANADLEDREERLKTALTQEQEQRTQAIDQTFRRLVGSARAALKRGELSFAEAEYDRALRVAPTGERNGLAVERLRTLTAHGRWERLQQELTRLAATAGLTPPQRAEVLMHQGDLDLWQGDGPRQKRGRQRLADALAVPGGLGGADAAYVRGVLAAGATPALLHFEEAVGREKFHLRANAALLMELALCGRHDDARRQGLVMARIFPAEPVVPLALALMAAREDDPSGDGHRAELARLVNDPARMKGLRAALDLIEAAARSIKREGDADVNLGRALLALAWRQAWDGPAANARADGVGLPLLHRPAELSARMQAIQKHLNRGNLDAAEPLLAEALPLWPELMLRVQAGVLHSARYSQALRANRPDAANRAELAYRVFAEAVDAPTMLPTGPHRRMAVWSCLGVEVSYAVEARKAAAAALLPLAGHPMGAVALAPLAVAPPADRLPRRDGCRYLRLVSEPAIGPDLGRPSMLPALLEQLDVDDARLLLLGWQRDEPRNAVPLKHLARLEYERGDYGRSLEWAERGCRVAFWDAEGWGLAAKARKKLQERPSTSPRPAAGDPRSARP